MKKILVAVDFSPESGVAISTAAELAAALDAEVTVLHVFETPAYIEGEAMILRHGAQGQSLVEVAMDNAKTKMDALLGRAVDAAEPTSRFAATRIEAGVPWRKICAIAEGEAFDLVVVGSHGRGRVMRLLLGSVGEQVLRHATVPTLVARAS